MGLNKLFATYMTVFALAGASVFVEKSDIKSLFQKEVIYRSNPVINAYDNRPLKKPSKEEYEHSSDVIIRQDNIEELLSMYSSQKLV